MEQSHMKWVKGFDLLEDRTRIHLSRLKSITNVKKIWCLYILKHDNEYIIRNIVVFTI